MIKGLFDAIIQDKDLDKHVLAIVTDCKQYYSIRSKYDAATDTAIGGMYDLEVDTNWVVLTQREASAGFPRVKIFLEYDFIEDVLIPPSFGDIEYIGYEVIPQVQNLLFDHIGIGSDLILDLPQIENLVFDQIGIGEVLPNSPSVLITYPANGQTILSTDAVDDAIDISWTINGAVQEDFFLFDSGSGNYQIHVAYSDPSTSVIGFDTINVKYEVV